MLRDHCSFFPLHRKCTIQPLLRPTFTADIACVELNYRQERADECASPTGHSADRMTSYKDLARSVGWPRHARHIGTKRATGNSDQAISSGHSLSGTYISPAWRGIAGWVDGMEAVVPTTEADAASLELQYVHRVYEEIADHFSDTRYKVGFPTPTCLS